jgi:hypothetical protein
MQSIGEEELPVYIASTCVISTRIINHDGRALDTDIDRVCKQCIPYSPPLPKNVYITTNVQIAVNQTTNQFNDYVSNDAVAFFSLE